MGTLKLSPSPIILFSTLPHQRATPLWPAGMMTKVPQRKMTMIMSKASIPTVRGFGHLNSPTSMVLSSIKTTEKYYLHNEIKSLRTDLEKLSLKNVAVVSGASSELIRKSG
jgi:hypothetical protein